MITILLEKIITILEGWLKSFTSHAQHVEDKLDSLDQTASDIKTNTEPISDIADNTGAVITPIQNIKSNTDSIKQSSQTSANNTTAILNNVSTLSTNTGRAAAFAEDCANNTLDIKNKVTTIASDTTQLRADTSELNSMSDKIYEAIKWSLADKYIDETESGPSPMSFDSDIADDLKALKIGIIGSQSGTGDPTPDNIRPITVYPEVNAVINGNALQLAFGQDVYLGYVDLISGKLVLNSKVFLVNSKSWNYDSTYKFFYTQIPDLKTPVNTQVLSGLICDSYTTRTAGQAGSGNINNSIAAFISIGIKTIRIKDNNITTVADFLTNDGNVMVVYPLETPAEVQLTASQIAAVKGVNTITSDTNGNIEVTYKESIKHYLDKQDN